MTDIADRIHNARFTPRVPVAEPLPTAVQEQRGFFGRILGRR